MKRVFLLAILILMLPCFIFAGGQGEEDGSGAGQSEKVEIKYAFWGNPDSIGVEQDIIDAYMEKNPNITITPVVSGFNDYATKLLTLAAGGEAPDVMRLSGNWIYDFKPICLDLNTLSGDQKVDTSVYVEGAVDYLEKAGGGALYGLPWGFGGRYCFINLALFDEYGLPYPDLDWTIEDFLNAAYTVREESNGEVYGFVAEPSIRNWLPFVWAYGGSFISEDLKSLEINQPEAVEGLKVALKVFQDLCPADVLTGANDLDTSLFASDKVLVAAGSPSRVRTFQSAERKFEAWASPVGPGGSDTNYTGGNLVSVYKDTKNLDAVLDFLTFLRGYEGEKLYSEANRVTPCFDSDELLDIYTTPRTGEYPKRYKEVLQHLKTNGRQRILRITKHYGEILRLADTYWSRVLSGDLPVQEAMDLLVEEGNAVLARD